jgi:phage host-nuclease inhibitor protein Gam
MQMKTKNAKRIKNGITALQFDEAMEKYAAAELREAEIKEAMEAEVNEVLEKYEDNLICIAQARNKAFEMAHSYCMANKETLFNGKRKIGGLHGIAGFRLGTPRLKTMPGSDWNNVLHQLKQKLPDYVRITEEPAKDLLLACRNRENVAPLLAEIGIQVVQDEIFFIELKKAA